MIPPNRKQPGFHLWREKKALKDWHPHRNFQGQTFVFRVFRYSERLGLWFQHTQSPSRSWGFNFNFNAYWRMQNLYSKHHRRYFWPTDLTTILEHIQNPPSLVLGVLTSEAPQNRRDDQGFDSFWWHWFQQTIKTLVLLVHSLEWVIINPFDNWYQGLPVP